jgi:hypothetical protein
MFLDNVLSLLLLQVLKLVFLEVETKFNNPFDKLGAGPHLISTSKFPKVILSLFLAVAVVSLAISADFL